MPSLHSEAATFYPPNSTTWFVILPHLSPRLCVRFVRKATPSPPPSDFVAERRCNSLISSYHSRFEGLDGRIILYFKPHSAVISEMRAVMLSYEMCSFRKDEFRLMLRLRFLSARLTCLWVEEIWMQMYISQPTQSVDLAEGLKVLFFYFRGLLYTAIYRWLYMMLYFWEIHLMSVRSKYYASPLFFSWQNWSCVTGFINVITLLCF